jgi:hypothetical protein
MHRDRSALLHRIYELQLGSREGQHRAPSRSVAALFRSLKPPGGHLLAFGHTRTHHRMVCAIEDAGFEIRDTIAWVHAQGFPKSRDVSKDIDRMAGVEREVITAPATPEARQWDGWGTGLKPSLELICLARKPLCGTVAANVLKHSTGALNIDGCLIECNDKTRFPEGTPVFEARCGTVFHQSHATPIQTPMVVGLPISATTAPMRCLNCFRCRKASRAMCGEPYRRLRHLRTIRKGGSAVSETRRYW